MLDQTGSNGKKRSANRKKYFIIILTFNGRTSYSYTILDRLLLS